MWNTLPIDITVCKFLLLFSTYFPCTIEYMTPYWVILRGNYPLYNFFGWNYLRGNGPAGNCPGGRWPQDNLPVAIKWGGQFFLHPVYAISFKQLSIFSFFWARKCRANYNWIFLYILIKCRLFLNKYVFENHEFAKASISGFHIDKAEANKEGTVEIKKICVCFFVSFPQIRFTAIWL